ncbi:MAG: hypothetical protein AAF333_16510 [Planctomycetota bacterium]
MDQVIDIEVDVQPAGSFGLWPGGAVSRVRALGGDEVRLSGGAVQNLEGTFSGPIASRYSDAQVSVRFTDRFVMTDGVILGEPGVNGQDAANVGLRLEYVDHAHIAGGRIEGGSGWSEWGQSIPNFFGQEPALRMVSGGNTVIDGGEFIGGSNTRTDFPQIGGLLADNAVVMDGGHLTINGGTFTGGDIVALQLADAESRRDYIGSAGLWVNYGVVDINGGTFRQGEFGDLYQPDDDYFYGAVTVEPGGEVNLRGGSIENLSARTEGGVNIYGTAFLLDGSTVEFGDENRVLLGAVGGSTLTVDFLGQGSETIHLADIRSSAIKLFLVSGIEGDLDADGFVSQADLDLVLLNWGAEQTPEGWIEATQFDGLISQNELDAVLLNWGGGSPPDLAAIPEPATAGFFLLGSAALLRRSR